MQLSLESLQSGTRVQSRSTVSGTAISTIAADSTLSAQSGVNTANRNVRPCGAGHSELRNACRRSCFFTQVAAVVDEQLEAPHHKIKDQYSFTCHCANSATSWLKPIQFGMDSLKRPSNPFFNRGNRNFREQFWQQRLHHFASALCLKLLHKPPTVAAHRRSAPLIVNAGHRPRRTCKTLKNASVLASAAFMISEPLQPRADTDRGNPTSTHLCACQTHLA